MLWPETGRPAARLAGVAGRMQTATAGAAFGPAGVGEIAVDGEQEVVESGIGQKRCVQGSVPLDRRCPTEMAKPGRNDRCPCGSGKKYKACCLKRDEAAETERLAAEQAGREERAAERRAELRQARDAITVSLLDPGPLDDVSDDELDAASNAVVDLIQTGKLDEAEAAARDLLVRYPDVHDGWDRLGMVHEARGDNAQAAECYRKLIDFLRQHPGYADPEMAEDYTKLVAKLDPPA